MAKAIVVLLLSYWVAIHGDPVAFAFLWLLYVVTEIPKEIRMTAATVAAGTVALCPVYCDCCDWTHIVVAIMAILVAIIEVIIDNPELISLFDDEAEEAEEAEKKYEVKGWEDL
jgi:Na+-transporting methylmalonyl-CoA/oxaloacetate decarboxylase gamma subunit